MYTEQCIWYLHLEVIRKIGTYVIIFQNNTYAYHKKTKTVVSVKKNIKSEHEWDKIFLFYWKTVSEIINIAAVYIKEKIYKYNRTCPDWST